MTKQDTDTFKFWDKIYFDRVFQVNHKKQKKKYTRITTLKLFTIYFKATLRPGAASTESNN